MHLSVSSGWRGDRVACFFSSHIYVKGILGDFGTSNLGVFRGVFHILGWSGRGMIMAIMGEYTAAEAAGYDYEASLRRLGLGGLCQDYFVIVHYRYCPGQGQGAGAWVRPGMAATQVQKSKV